MTSFTLKINSVPLYLCVYISIFPCILFNNFWILGVKTRVFVTKRPTGCKYAKFERISCKSLIMSEFIRILGFQGDVNKPKSLFFAEFSPWIPYLLLFKSLSFAHQFRIFCSSIPYPLLSGRKKSAENSQIFHSKLQILCSSTCPDFQIAKTHCPIFLLLETIWKTEKKRGGLSDYFLIYSELLS